MKSKLKSHQQYRAVLLRLLRINLKVRQELLLTEYNFYNLWLLLKKNQLELLCCPLFSPDIIGAVYPLGLAATVKESKLAAGLTSIVDVGPLVVKVSKSNLIVHISEK